MAFLARNRKAMGTFGAFLLACAVALYCFLPYEFLFSQNAYFHLGAARLYGAGNLFHPAGLLLPGSEFEARFLDQHYYYHLLLAFLLKLLPPLVAVKALQAAALGFLAASIAWSLRVRSALLRTAFAFAFVFSGMATTERLFWGRPTPIVLGLFFLSLFALSPPAAARRRLGCIVFAAAGAFSFESLAVALPLAIVFLLRPSRTLGIYALCLLGGFFFHPDPLQKFGHLVFLLRQNFFLETYVQEWLRPREYPLQETVLIASAYLMNLVMLAVRPRERRSVLAVSFLVLAPAFLFAYRFLVYACLLAFLVLAGRLSVLQLRGRRRREVLAAVTVFLVAGVCLFQATRTVGRLRTGFRGDSTVRPGLDELGAWLRAHPGARILNFNWTDWSQIFAAAPAVAAAPGFSLALYEKRNPGFSAAYLAWRNQPSKEATRKLADLFGATHFLIGKTEAQYPAFREWSAFPAEFENRHVALYSLTEKAIEPKLPGREELEQAFAPAAGFLRTMIANDGAFRYPEPLRTRWPRELGDTPSHVHQNLLVWALCEAERAAPPARRALCADLAASRLQQQQSLRRAENLGELATLGLALSATPEPGTYRGVLGGIRAEILRFLVPEGDLFYTRREPRSGVYSVDEDNEAFYAGEALLFFVKNGGDAAQLSKLIARYRGRFQERPHVYYVRWFAEALSEVLRKRAEPEAEAFLRSILEYVEGAMYTSGEDRLLGCWKRVRPESPSFPYPSHLSGLVVEGLSIDPIHAAKELRRTQRRLAALLWGCTLRQQLPSGFALGPKELERDLAGSWLSAEHSVGSRPDVHGHLVLALSRWLRVIDHWRDLPLR